MIEEYFPKYKTTNNSLFIRKHEYLLNEILLNYTINKITIAIDFIDFKYLVMVEINYANQQNRLKLR